MRADGEYSSTRCALLIDGGLGDRVRLTQELGEPADLTDQSVPRLDPSAPFSSRPVTVGLAILAGAGALAVGAGVVAVVAMLVLRRRP
ncbi:hypothetical protein [Brachybacterium sp. FME24]|uniref:hypothetical protein n=1 Tax=Brachybacterium sp. FME24 TaxID=2742605 RepID=UPI001866A55A|nr:hypothetical protein [Brachybacterium sp. FME24]